MVGLRTGLSIFVLDTNLASHGNWRFKIASNSRTFRSDSVGIADAVCHSGFAVASQWQAPKHRSGVHGLFERQIQTARTKIILTAKKIVYLVNQYPKVSHTFIRREILALETLGLNVMRLSVRGWENELPDPVDEQERQKTRYLLRQGVGSLLWSGMKVFMQRPATFLNTLFVALRMGVRADRAWPFHLIYLLEACKALEWLQQDNIEHVHAHFGGNSTEVAMLIRLLGGPPYSFTVHGPEEFDKPEFIHLGAKVKHSAFTVAITSYCRSQIFRWIPYSQWHKVQVVRCGIDAPFHENLPDTFPAEPRLVCIGRLCEQKGQLILLEAALKLKLKKIRSSTKTDKICTPFSS